MLLGWCCHFPDYAFHTSGFLGQGTGVMKLGVVTQVYAMLGNGCFRDYVYYIMETQLY
jgi:hypothetical protein